MPGAQPVLPGAQPVIPAAVSRSPVQGTTSQVGDGTMQHNEQKSGAPVLEGSFLNQVDHGKQDKSNSKRHEATIAEKKVLPMLFWFYANL